MRLERAKLNNYSVSYRSGLRFFLIAALALAMSLMFAHSAMAKPEQYQPRNHHNNHHHNNNNGNNNNGGGDNDPHQTNEQENESGDSSQTFTVTGGGDNSDACQGTQGDSNSGSALNNTGILQDVPDGEVEVDDSGNFEESPSSTTTCDQQVNQAASASG